MPLATIFKDSPEYENRKRTPFRPPKVCIPFPSCSSLANRPQVTVADIRSAIPKHLYQKSTLKGCYYFVRDLLFTIVLYNLATRIEALANSVFSFLSSSALNPATQRALIVVIQWSGWCLYFYWQGIAFAGLWCLGHEAGHGTLSTYPWLNTIFGFILHTVRNLRSQFTSSHLTLNIKFLLIPYFSWRSTHHAHHVSLHPFSSKSRLSSSSRTGWGSARCLNWPRVGERPNIDWWLSIYREQRCLWSGMRTMFPEWGQIISCLHRDRRSQ